MYRQTYLCSHNHEKEILLYIYILFMVPCNIIIIKCYDGTALPHINNHGTQFKIQNTYFFHSYYPHHTQVHSRL